MGLCYPSLSLPHHGLSGEHIFECALPEHGWLSCLKWHSYGDIDKICEFSKWSSVSSMDKKQNPYDLGLLAAGIGLIVGSFSPWISVLIVNIAGTAGFRGYITLVSGLIVSLYAATRLWPNLLDAKFSSKLSLLSKISLAASVIVLVEVAIRIKQVAGQMNDVADTQPVTQATDDIFGGMTQAFDDFAKSLADAFKPRLAMGWYVCLVSVAVAIALVFIQSRSSDVNEQSSVG